MSLHGELTGAAARRRGRRLRSWLRHERQTVAMVLAEIFHHSSALFPPKFKEEWVGRHEQHAAPRGPKTARTTEATHFTSSTTVARGPELFSLEEEPGGGRPAPLSEVTGPQSAVTAGYVAAGVPLLGAPSMASPSAEAIDESTLSFLLGGNLARVKEEEEEKEMQAELATKEQVLVSEIEGRGGHVSAAALHDVSYDSLFSFLFGVWVLPESPSLLDF